MTDDPVTDRTHRELVKPPGAQGEAFTLRLRRGYDAPVEEVWDACTDPERLKRWFVPVTGDLREGGTFSLEGNASGQILRCQPPHLLRLTWAYGDRPADEVELRLASVDDGGTVLELDHSSVTRWVELDGRMVDVVLNDPDTGIWGLGTGWEMGLVGLGSFLAGELPDAPTSEWFDPESPEIQELVRRCGRAWAAVVEAGGGGPAA